MTGKEYVLFDFRSSGATDDSIGLLKAWMHSAADIFKERLAHFSKGPVDISFRQVLSRTFESQISDIDPSSFGFEIDFAEIGEPTLVYISCSELVALVSCLLGNNVPEVEESRKLTSIEMSIGQLVIEAMTAALSESWPGEKGITITPQQIVESPHRSRILPLDSIVLRIEFRLEVESAKVTVVWLLQRNKLESVLKSMLGSNFTESDANPREIVELLELELVAFLGQSEMCMRDVSELHVGDLILLDQKINNPIEINVCGNAGFHAWPGRIGKQQCVQVIDLA